MLTSKGTAASYLRPFYSSYFAKVWTKTTPNASSNGSSIKGARDGKEDKIDMKLSNKYIGKERKSKERWEGKQDLNKC